MLTLSALQSMTIDERWALIDNSAVSVQSWESAIKPCKPNWIGPLYTNTPMPHYTQKDGTSILLDEDNVYNGVLEDKDETDAVVMRWKGYTCQLYDGQLKMCTISQYSCIVGACNDIAFKFKGTNLEYGVWPGFLLLYKKSERV